MDGQPIIDLGHAAELALTRMLETGRVIGRDGQSRKVIAMPRTTGCWTGSPSLHGAVRWADLRQARSLLPTTAPEPTPRLPPTQVP